jgi:hypothetical protein
MLKVYGLDRGTLKAEGAAGSKSLIISGTYRLFNFKYTFEIPIDKIGV